MQRRLVLLLLALLSRSPALDAQDARVSQLVETVWTQGTEAALGVYAALPAANRSAALLLSVADQLLWTGKHVAATRLLAQAEIEAPLLAEVRFQQGRAALQRGETVQALAAFRSGLSIIDRDTSLTEQTRGPLRRRLENRIGFLTRSEDLLSRSGGYRLPDGHLLLFKFDPYLNTFPALMELSTGVVRTLYPAGSSGLEWRDENNRPIGSLGFQGGTGNSAVLVIRDGTGESRASGLDIVRETLRFQTARARIEGTLFRPAGTSRVPAVVLTHGAGFRADTTWRWKPSPMPRPAWRRLFTTNPVWA